ncbi:hypothetical protein LAZ67_18000564, partial [Cordylochernes scorpioides]
MWYTDMGLDMRCNNNRMKGPLLAFKCHGTRDVFMVSTAHDHAMIPVTKKARKSDQSLTMKPAAVLDYNKHKAGVDRSDQLLPYYSFQRRTMKWWKRLFFHIFGLTIVNSHIIYNKLNPTSKLSLRDYHLVIMEKLVEEAGVEITDQQLGSSSSKARLLERHFITRIKEENKPNVNIQRKCKVCAEKGKSAIGKRIRKDTAYMCKTCLVPLCINDCFEAFHTKEKMASVKDDFLHYATNPESELEDTDSDCTIVYDYEESSGEDEEVPPPLKTPQSGYIWSDNSNYDPIIFSFDRSNSGLQVDTCRLEKELDFFEIFININFLEMIAVETNKYAKYLIDTIEFSKFSRMNRWVDTNYHELFVFLAICFLMTRNKKVSLKEYWSTNQFHFSPIFSKLMSRDRLFLILSVLHFNDNKTQIPGDKLHKLKPVVDHMKSAYKNAFKPFQDVCIDESLVLFKGRFGFKQYIPSKRKRFGIKLFVLCYVETKYILDFIVYVGKGTEIEDSDMGVSSSVITTLLQPYMNKGHSLWVDNWYSSPTLFNFLHQRQTNACGTDRKNRKEMPRFGKKLKIGETEAKHTQNLLALKYKDKREVFMLSTMHKNEFANTNKRDKVNNLPIQKPSAVIDYNQKMGTVDQTDMLLSSIGCLRKSLKWYKKLFFHFIDTSLLNAYSLYLVNTGKRPSLAKFHINLIGQIIEKYHEARVQVHRGRPSTSEDRPLRLIERHFPSLVPPTEKKKNPTRYCRVCGANKKRKESRYMCKDCDVA